MSAPIPLEMCRRGKTATNLHSGQLEPAAGSSVLPEVAGVWADWGHVLIAAAVALPLAAVAVFALVRWRTANGVACPVRRSLAEVGAVVATSPWLWMVLTPRPGERGVALVPLRDLVDLLDGRTATLIVQLVGNLLVLAAFGAFLPMRFAALARMRRVAVVAVGMSVTIEVLQYALDLGRVSSVDDVLVNTIGALAGAALSRRWWAVPQGRGSE
ncbi:VanZ family protein [Saccharopolyspora sp. 5N708]|uniref:VanZ family protein n=1 Tax=Saccharopolyspora sp. 5N708 TaxID=3457424 RepID=UPI003FD08BF3